MNRKTSAAGYMRASRIVELRDRGLSVEAAAIMLDLLCGEMRMEHCSGLLFFSGLRDYLGAKWGLSVKKGRDAWNELEKIGVLKWDTQSKFVWMPEFWRHNRVLNLKHAQGVASEIRQARGNPFFREMLEVFARLLEESRQEGGDKQERDEAAYGVIIEALKERIEPWGDGAVPLVMETSPVEMIIAEIRRRYPERAQELSEADVLVSLEALRYIRRHLDKLEAKAQPIYGGMLAKVLVTITEYRRAYGKDTAQDVIRWLDAMMFKYQSTSYRKGHGVFHFLSSQIFATTAHELGYEGIGKAFDEGGRPSASEWLGGKVEAR